MLVQLLSASYSATTLPMLQWRYDDIIVDYSFVSKNIFLAIG